jgi:two-component sensor histidine kinase
MHHRVKNNFSILISLMNMQRVDPDEVDAAGLFNELQLRVRTMSLIHEMLYRSENVNVIVFGHYLENLSEIINSAFGDKNVRTHTRFDTCVVGIDIVVPLGLIVNELLTNAYKYAFRERDTGEIWIELIRLPEEKDNGGYSHELVIRDDGRGLPEGFNFHLQESMGFQIVSLLVEQIEAKMEYSGTNGTTFSILFLDQKKRIS